MARIHLKTQFSVGSDLFWKTQLSFYFNLFWKTQKIDRTLLAGISSNCFCSWKFEGSNLPKEARSQIWDGDLNIWNNKSHLSLYLINSISIFLDIWTYKKTHMHDQMAFTHGTIYIQNVTRFFCHFVGPYCWQFSREKIAGRERLRAPSSQSSHLRCQQSGLQNSKQTLFTFEFK